MKYRDELVGAFLIISVFVLFLTACFKAADNDIMENYCERIHGDNLHFVGGPGETYSKNDECCINYADYNKLRDEYVWMTYCVGIEE